MAGHVGRIPNYGKSQVNPMGSVEPPACIQNAMMTKDKKPFTYTPGGLDLSQIRTPSMARRLARQRSQEEQEQAYAQANPGTGNYHPQGGPRGPIPPPPPPPGIPAPPPPPPLVIEAPRAKSPKPVAPGIRPEIVIPENPIGMLRKTNSPYHWEAEKADVQRLGPVPKFVDKVPSPLTVKMPPSSFSQQPPPTYTPPGQNNYQRNNYQYQNNQAPDSPIHRPEAQYAHQKSASPNVNGSPLTRELLQRQDSQFNKSPQPFNGQSPISNGSPYSPSPNNNWKQPEKRESPASNVASPQSPQHQRSQFSPNVQQYPSNYATQTSPNYPSQPSPGNAGPAFHTLPRPGSKSQEIPAMNAQNNNAIYNNTGAADNATPWRTNTLSRPPREPDNLQSIYHNSQNVNQQPTYNAPWKSNEVNNNQVDNAYVHPWKQENNQANQQQQYNPWATSQDANNNKTQDDYIPPWKSQLANDNRSVPISPPSRQNQPQEQPRYQSSMSIPVTPKKQPEQNNTPQKEVVYVNQEPVYFCPDSPNSMPPWVKTQKEKTKTPPPTWCQRPLEGRKSLPRELVTPPRDANQEPEWVKKSNEIQRGVREVISPPKYQQPVQPTWSTRPSDNRKSLPRESTPIQQAPRVIPIQMDGGQGSNQPPPLRIVINMHQNPNVQGPPTQAPYSQPTQRIMRVLSPQLVRMDDGPQQHELPTLNRDYQNNQEQNQPKTRIIPIQIEGGNGGANKSFGGRY